MSFGSWVGLTVGADDERVSTLIGIAMPLNRYDFARIRDSAKPKFFIHGEFDEVCPLKTVREFYAQAAEPKELVVIDSADHVFDGKVSEVADAIEDLLGTGALGAGGSGLGAGARGTGWLMGGLSSRLQQPPAPAPSPH